MERGDGDGQDVLAAEVGAGLYSTFSSFAPPPVQPLLRETLGERIQQEMSDPMKATGCCSSTVALRSARTGE